MSREIAKNQTVSYAAFSHFVHRAGEDESYYCRAANAVLSGEFVFCGDCPLCAGFYEDAFDGQNPECLYFDLDAGYADEMSPDVQKKRTDGLIAAGITREFPEYLPDDEKGRRFALIERAMRFAADAHKGCFRKGSSLPYIVHPMETMMLTAKMGGDTETIAAAALHDVVEDTPFTALDIEQNFGERIAELVSLESENKRENLPKSETWRTRKEESLTREQNAPREAKLIMLADKISNMRSTVRDFRKNGNRIWDKFNMKDPAAQEWYYRGVAKVLSDLSDLPQYEEYCAMLDEVFG